MPYWVIQSGLDAQCPFAELLRHDFVVRTRRDEGQRMNTASLPDAVDPADPLFKTERGPRNFEVDDEAAAAVEVQPFARRVGGEK